MGPWTRSDTWGPPRPHLESGALGLGSGLGQTPPLDPTQGGAAWEGGVGRGRGGGGAGGRGRASVHGISAGWRETGVWSQPGRPFPQPPSKVLPWRWPGLGPGTPGPRPLSCCSCSGALPSPSRSVSWGPSLGGPRAAPQAVGCPCGAGPDCRVQGGAHLGATGACVVAGDFVGGPPPAGVRVTGGPCVLERCWAGLCWPVRPESGGSHVSCAQVMGCGL